MSGQGLVPRSPVGPGGGLDPQRQLEEAKARQWYEKIVSNFPQSPMAGKAAGAKRRLESVGKSITLGGTTLDGQRMTLQSLRGQTVRAVHESLSLDRFDTRWVQLMLPFRLRRGRRQ